MNRMMIGLVCLLLGAAGAHAAHWTVNPHGYRYDMSVYAVLHVNGKAIADYSSYEVAAFFEEECRGVAKVQSTADGTPFLYLRVYSNEAQGEALSFKVYKPSDSKERVLPETTAFESQAMVGTPGEPFVLTIEEALQGDANSDGVVNIADVTAIINYINGAAATSFSFPNADVNGDGVINIADVTGVINIINQ